MISAYAKNAIVLGLLSAVGSFAIDMYLPALPTIAADLNASTASTQMTLTAFFMAFGLCQMVYGPISDMAGRKPPLYVGLALFTLGSIGCALSPEVGELIAFRFLQGIGASAVMVIPRAIIRDLHTGIEATRLMALVMLVVSVSPMLAPLTGSALIVFFGWRAVFATLTILAVLGLILMVLFLPETRPPQDRFEVGLRNVFAGFGQLLCDWHFLGLTFIGGLGTASFFVFLASSSFIYIDHYGLTPTAFSFVFSSNALGFIGASQFAAKLGTRFGMKRVVVTSTSAFALLTTILMGLNLAGVDCLAIMIVLLFFAFAVMGLVIPSTMVLALEEHGPIAGIASALGGTLQMATGGIMIVIVSTVFDGTARPMVTTIALCAIGTLLLSLATLRQRGLAPKMVK